MRMGPGGTARLASNNIRNSRRARHSRGYQPAGFEKRPRFLDDLSDECLLMSPSGWTERNYTNVKFRPNPLKA
jgi:hypothetical protein